MNREWYSSAYEQLKTELHKSKSGVIQGNTFLLDFFIDNPVDDFTYSEDGVDGVQAYVREVIDDFQLWLQENAEDTVQIGNRYKWQSKVAVNNLQAKEIPENLNLLSEDEVQIKNKAVLNEDEIVSLEKILSKYRNTDDVTEIYNLTLKIANWHEENTELNSTIAQWWESVVISSSKAKIKQTHMWHEKAAKYYSLNNDHAKSGQFYESALERLEIETLELETDNEERQKIFTECVELCRLARSQYGSALNGEAESRVYIKECELITRKANCLSKLFRKLYGWVSNYGESPWRVLLSAFVLIFGCAALYFFTDINNNNHCGTISFWDSLYYSVVTFSTLGYGDFSPCTGLGKLIASCQSLSGLLLTSLFLVTFVRRFHR
ncbi:potassium channel family protein [Methylophaga thalassica]|uniref:potassium channel family protein n=1 Tax=Methylophaga aminisulfidivorans TaxID=230105 RepID=UPI0024E19E17|nr:potassium channel family protein [Methylophaga aminisulfidivorans]